MSSNNFWITEDGEPALRSGLAYVAPPADKTAQHCNWVTTIKGTQFFGQMSISDYYAARRKERLCEAQNFSYDQWTPWRTFQHLSWSIGLFLGLGMLLWTLLTSDPTVSAITLALTIIFPVVGISIALKAASVHTRQIEQHYEAEIDRAVGTLHPVETQIFVRPRADDPGQVLTQAFMNSVMKPIQDCIRIPKAVFGVVDAEAIPVVLRDWHDAHFELSDLRVELADLQAMMQRLEDSGDTGTESYLALQERLEPRREREELLVARVAGLECRGVLERI